MAGIDFDHGLAEIGDGLWAYLQPDGGWGWSNAGLVAGEDRSLLVDTLFDLPLTRSMLDSMDAITTTRPIRTLVNTHANGDHCFGNQLVADAEIVSTEACLEEFQEVPASALEAMVGTDFGDPVVNEYIQAAFGPFDFGGIVATPPTRVFSGRLDLTIGGRPVELIDVGPAHTKGDLLVHVPDGRTVFTGDILFVHGTPIVWAGPVDNWIRACDLIGGLDVEVIVPGHGPVIDKRGPEMVRDYLAFVQREATERNQAGMSAAEAARDIDLGEFAEWTDSERLAVNVHAVYSDLDPSHVLPAWPQLASEMAHLARRRKG